MEPVCSSKEPTCRFLGSSTNSTPWGAYSPSCHIAVLQTIFKHTNNRGPTRCPFTPWSRECTYRWRAMPMDTAPYSSDQDPHPRPLDAKSWAVAITAQRPACIWSIYSDIGTLRVVTARELVVLGGSFNMSHSKSVRLHCHLCCHSSHKRYTLTVSSVEGWEANLHKPILFQMGPKPGRWGTGVTGTQATLHYCSPLLPVQLVACSKFLVRVACVHKHVTDVKWLDQAEPFHDHSQHSVLHACGTGLYTGRVTLGLVVKGLAVLAMRRFNDDMNQLAASLLPSVHTKRCSFLLCCCHCLQQVLDTCKMGQNRHRRGLEKDKYCCSRWRRGLCPLNCCQCWSNWPVTYQ